MRSRPLGKTGLECSELALGTWGLSGDAYGPVSRDEQEKVLGRAVALGITLFETADCYAQGGMEALLAQTLAPHPHCRIVSKIGTMVNGTPRRKRFDESFLYESLCNSMARHQPRQPDVLLLHNPSLETVQNGEATKWLHHHMQAGYFRSWGVSAGSASVAAAAMAQGAPVVELAFNVLWSGDYQAIEEQARSHGTALIARSVLAHGLLSGFWSSDRTFPPNDHRSERWTREELHHRLQQLDALRPLLGGEISTLRSVALRWVLQHELVSTAVLGPRSCLQLDQLVREAGKGPPYLSPASIQALETRLSDLGARTNVGVQPGMSHAMGAEK
ncbi:MAG: aldo/keto reductase [Myxococcales bacterium]